MSLFSKLCQVKHGSLPKSKSMPLARLQPFLNMAPTLFIRYPFPPFDQGYNPTFILVIYLVWSSCLSPSLYTFIFDKCRYEKYHN